jgi:hypothetical protein
MLPGSHRSKAATDAEMKLASKDGQAFEMRILQYQFPHREFEDYDSNWLMMGCEVVHPRGAWQFRDPCLLTQEGERLAIWMDAVAEGKPLPTHHQKGRPSQTCDFIEPNLEFEAIFGVQRPVLRVYFKLEARPKWKQTGKIWVEFPLEELDLRSTAQQWREELSAYPPRAPDDD